MSTLDKIKVFLSHNSSDKPVVEALAQKILIEETDIEPWLDKWYLTPGTPWQEDLEAALQTCDVCLVFIGSNDFGSWQHEEMRNAINRRVEGKRCRVIPVLLPNAERPLRSGLPMFLLRNHWVEFHGDIDNAEAYQLLLCGIRGKHPGPSTAIKTPVSECPYVGLRSFTESTSHLFFGRESATDWVIADMRRWLTNLNTLNALALVGASGSGKSSLVLAGVIPRLRRSSGLRCSSSAVMLDTQPLKLRPSNAPLDRLRESLMHWADKKHTAKIPGKALFRKQFIQGWESGDHSILYGWLNICRANENLVLIIVDQFEEIFSLCDDSKERAAFLYNLLYCTTPISGNAFLLITLRDDFYGKCVAYPELAALVSQQDYLVGPLSDDELRRALEEPALLVGVTPDSALIERLLADAGDNKAVLPLIQHVMTELWHLGNSSCISKELNLTNYQALGGLAGALAKHADEAIKDINQVTLKACQRLFTHRLIRHGEGTQDTRRIALWSELAEDEKNIATQLVNARLLVVEGSDLKNTHTIDIKDTERNINNKIERIEIAHEALIRGWGTLQSWLSIDREASHLHQRIADATTEYVDQNRDDGLLWTGTLLARSVDLLADSPNDFGQEQRNFIEKALAAAQARAQKQAHQQRRMEQFAISLVLIALGLVITMVGLYIALEEADVAKKSLQIKLAENFHEQASQDLSSQHLILSALNLAAAAETLPSNIEKPNSTAYISYAAFMRSPAKIPLLQHNVGHILGVAMNNDGSRILSWSDDKTVRIWDSISGQSLHILKHDYFVRGALFSADASRILSWGDDKTIRIWDSKNGRVLQALRQEHYVMGAIFSADASHILSWSNDKAVRLLDSISGQILQILPHSHDVNGALLNIDASRILSWSTDKTLRLWDSRNGNIMQKFLHNHHINGALLSIDSSRIFSWGDGKTVRIWDSVSGQPLRELRHGSNVMGMILSTDGSRILSWGDDNVMRLWGNDTGQALQTFRHDYYVMGALFNTDTSRILSWGDDNIVRLWDSISGHALQTIRHDRDVRTALFSVDESRILSLSSDKRTIRPWDISSGGALKNFQHERNVRGALFSSDESHILSWGDDNTIRLWATDHDRALQAFRHGYYIRGALFNSDSSRILSWSSDKTAKLWDSVSGQVIHTLNHDDDVRGALFNSDSSRILSWSSDKTAKLWDNISGQVIHTLKHNSYVNGALFSFDDSRVLSWSSDKAVRLWDSMSGQVLHTLQHENYVNGVLLSADASRLLSWSSDKAVRLWDSISGQLLHTLQHNRDVKGVLFSADASTILSWGEDNNLRLWSSDEGYALQVFQHNRYVKGALFSNDGLRILSWSDDNTVRLWDAQHGAELYRFYHDGPVSYAAFNRSENQILSYGKDRKVKIWSLPNKDNWPVNKSVLRIESLLGYTVDTNGNLISLSEQQHNTRLQKYNEIKAQIEQQQLKGINNLKN